MILIETTLGMYLIEIDNHLNTSSVRDQHSLIYLTLFQTAAGMIWVTFFLVWLYLAKWRW